MYKIESILVYNGKALGLRLYKQVGDTSWLQDVDIQAIKGLKKTHVKSYPVEELVEHGDLLITQRELKYGFRVEDVTSDVNEVDRIRRLLLTEVPPSLLKQVAQEVFREIVNAPNIGASVKELYIDDFENLYPEQSKGFRKAGILRARAKFIWNDDHDYCERHYDAFGVIDDCLTFDKWVEYGKQVMDKYTQKYPVSVNFELRGVKYEIRLSVETKSDCILR